MPNPSGSDMWVVEASGDGEAELTWAQQPGRWTVLAVSTDGSAPRVSLAWPQEVTTPWLWPAVGVGSLLVVLAAALLVRDLRRARRGPEADWTPVLTGPLPTVGADGAPVQLTRRQLRELAAHGALADSGVAAPRDETPRHDETAPRPDDAPAAPTSSAPTGAEDAGAGRRARRAGAAPDDASRPEGSTQVRPVPEGPVPDGPPSVAQGPGSTALRPDDARHRGPAGDPVRGPAGPEASPTTPGPAWLSRAPKPSPGVGPSGAAPSAPVAGGDVAREARTSGRPDSAPGAGAAADSRRAAPGTPAAPTAQDPHGTARQTAQGASHGTARPGWAPVPPPPGAVVGRADGPDAGGRAPDSRAPRTPTGPEGAEERAGETSGAAAPRPAWLRDAPTPPGPRAAGRDAAGADPAASRADAWRRAWGLPPLPTDDDSPEEGR
ncbi:hypothetical protein [Cellulomonas sp. FA1]|uniref:hypothetical protein n=1 Tax=Cellulomonas sp. FA1 TaxID=1346710 RepID=UPI000624FA6A|nr:hypothetical protein [Cellulomonas sp. FA1]